MQRTHVQVLDKFEIKEKKNERLELLQEQNSLHD